MYSGSVLLLASLAIGLAPSCAHPEAAATNQIPVADGLRLIDCISETLGHDPYIQLQQRQVQVAKGALGVASGQFDPAFVTALSQGVTRLPRSKTDIELGDFKDTKTAVQDLTVYRAGITNQFRSGISAGTGFELDRFSDNLYQGQPANRANVSFVLRVPLLRGAGRVATTAQEEAARINREATILDLQQAISARVLNTVSAYWNCLAAVEQLEVLKKSRDGATSLVGVIGALVRVRELAGSELLQAQANEAQKDASVSAGEQAVWQARQDLAQAIGFKLEKMTNPPVPSEDFPKAGTNSTMMPNNEQQLIADSLNRRADYRSSLKAQDAARILEAAARNNTKPQLDLNFLAGYSGLKEGSGFGNYIGALDPTTVSGPNLLGTVSLEWPFGNHGAQGLLLQRTAEEQQTQLRSQALERSIRSGILVALRNLENSRAELEHAQDAVRHYGLAVTNEVAKLRRRASTILDVITLGDRMESALLGEITARAHYWIALVRCRYETGWLVPDADAAQNTYTIPDVIVLPPWDQDKLSEPRK
jgi:outer membrane protein TolC